MIWIPTGRLKMKLLKTVSHDGGKYNSNNKLDDDEDLNKSCESDEGTFKQMILKTDDEKKLTRTKFN
ncbi:hypothetical protein CVS40_12335 [Lucilia cuprina]|nr:hypothetical protein CVS40_12335 [Lucilia cuprina]